VGLNEAYNKFLRRDEGQLTEYEEKTRS